jgi:hypothetical protein
MSLRWEKISRVVLGSQLGLARPVDRLLGKQPGHRRRCLPMAPRRF